MFWGGEKLKAELPKLVSDFDSAQLDGASYRLRVGPEVYVSPTGEPDDPRNKPKTQLKDGEGFTIPAGQFGFLLTEERVKVPMAAIAFISIRARYKFRGLVNVSGFHVDPHYEGRLIFSVFNAGPGPVHLARGERCFLIWYADLDGPSVVGKKEGFDNIPSELTGPIAGGLQSLAGLSSKITENDKKMGDRIAAVERDQAVIKAAAAVVISVLVALGVRECSVKRPADPPYPAAVASAPAGAASLPAVVKPSPSAAASAGP